MCNLASGEKTNACWFSTTTMVMSFKRILWRRIETLSIKSSHQIILYRKIDTKPKQKNISERAHKPAKTRLFEISESTMPQTIREISAMFKQKNNHLYPLPALNSCIT